MRTLDVFGPAEVFGDANWLRGGVRAYRVNIISACADRVVSSHLGTPVHTDWTYREYRGPIDTLLLAGRMGPAPSAEVFRRMFRRRLQVTPAQYRAPFVQSRAH